MNIELTCNQIEEQGSRRVVLIVPKQYVKTVKTALERHGKLDQTVKISPESNQSQPRDDARRSDGAEDRIDRASSDKMRIATTIAYQPNDEVLGVYHEALLLEVTNDLNIIQISDKISISHHTPLLSATNSTPKNPLHKALQSALATLPDTIFTTSNLTRSSLVSSFPDGYSIYPPLLLLPHNALASSSWTSLLAAHAPTSPTLAPFWSTFASTMNITHIAINSPIPLTQSTLSASTNNSNILRSPLNITPLFGDFGTTPTESNKQHPTPEDFANAFWVSTTQNGIHQVWAPLYTMFSRGNIREKTRVLRFPRHADEAEAVVDMYAGIGYFSFSYRASRFRPVFCFELNPWSVEGLRRGVERNGWTCKIYDYQHHKITNAISGKTDLGVGGGVGGKDEVDVDVDVDFHIFNISNTHALPLLTPFLEQESIPPIRHVNLGLLPRSRDSWNDAVALVDKREGGWIHAHENVGVAEMEAREGEVERMFQGYLDGDGKGEGRERKARVEHVERVKMYAPGVVHVVFDVWVSGVQER